VRIRQLTSLDIPLALPLMAELGYPSTSDAFSQRLTAVLSDPNGNVLVAEVEKQLLGLIGLQSFEMLHRPGRLGRVTALVVAESARGCGVGTSLLRAAEAHLLEAGCVMLEVTSAENRADAHAFYEAHGYHEKRRRFVKLPG
jgi:ribosomal protein S18 acetylase RimI-like enzyme